MVFTDFGEFCVKLEKLHESQLKTESTRLMSICPVWITDYDYSV